MANGGRGLMLIDLEPKDTLAGAAAYTRSVRIIGRGGKAREIRGGKEREETLEIRSLEQREKRAAKKASANVASRKGKVADLGSSRRRSA
jgi:topoisomerase-4 subunit A